MTTRINHLVRQYNFAMVTNKPMQYLTAQVKLKSTKSSFVKDVLNLKSMQRPLTL